MLALAIIFAICLLLISIVEMGFEGAFLLFCIYIVGILIDKFLSKRRSAKYSSTSLL